MKALGDIEVVNLSTGKSRLRLSGDGESVLIESHKRIDEPRFGPGGRIGPTHFGPKSEDVVLYARKILRERKSAMHYRNGREAKNGDKIVKLEGGKIVSFGVLHSATPGNDYCNGNIAVIQPPNDYACMCDCLHVDDVGVMLAEKNLDKRPSDK